MYPVRPIAATLLLAGSAALAIGTAPAALASGRSLASTQSCSPGAVCERTLGVAIAPPPGWFQLPAGKFPAHTLAFSNGKSGLSYTIRLVIEPFALTSPGNDRQASALVANKLIAAERASGVTRTRVSYGGAPGVSIRGLPGSPGPATDIVLAHRGAAYLIIVPGASLAPDQVKALSSLRFISRHGNFLPPAQGGR